MKAILFDIGGTLLDFRRMDWRLAFRDAGRQTYAYLRELGHDLPEFEPYFRLHASSVRWAFVKSLFVGRDFCCHKLLRSNCRRIGVEVQEPQLRELAWLWYSPLADNSSIADGVAATLRNLRGRGYKLGLVSNTFIPRFVMDRQLAMHGLLDLFPVRIYSSETGHRKPGRKIFRAALRELGVPAFETVFVGDKVWNDIVGARRAGMRTILRQRNSDATRHFLADHVIRQISELEMILPTLEENEMPAVEELAYET